MKVVHELGEVIGVASACRALGLPRATFYRQAVTRSSAASSKPLRRCSRALTDAERATVLEQLNDERFMDLPPPQVYARLLDQGTYLCSISTMYRLLRAAEEVRERRDQLQRPRYQRPELVATTPNQVWSWDITKLLGPKKWTYYYLYVILDIFSRYVVAWMVATREASRLAKRLIKEACTMQDIAPGELTIHADRGASMTSKSVAFLLADLGVTKSHSRPHVSDDNPYSESQFKTLKYRPGFLDRFGSSEDARSTCSELFAWYNHEHRHSSIGFLTPAEVHFGRAHEIIAHRDAVLAAAHAVHPERFVNKPPAAPRVPTAVWINPPRSIEIAQPGLPDRVDSRSSILGDPGTSTSRHSASIGALRPLRVEVAAH